VKEIALTLGRGTTMADLSGRLKTGKHFSSIEKPGPYHVLHPDLRGISMCVLGRSQLT